MRFFITKYIGAFDFICEHFFVGAFTEAGLFRMLVWRKADRRSGKAGR